MKKNLEFLKNTGLASNATIIGCNKTEIAEVKEQWSQKLPLAYLEFLQTMGKEAGRLFVGSEIFYPECLELRESAVELLSEFDKEDVLPDDAIVFSMHQGYQFLFFKSSEGDDPPVYHYSEGKDYFTKIRDSFSYYIYCSIQDHL